MEKMFQDPKVKGVISDIHAMSESLSDISSVLGKILKELEKSNRLKEKELSFKEQELELEYEKIMHHDLEQTEEQTVADIAD